MITTTKSIVSYEILCLWENFQGTYFRNAFFKTCQYTTMDEKVYKGLKYVFIKIAQRDMQKCFTWPKKSRNGTQEWNKACANSSLPPRKLNTLVMTKYNF
jgi:hypothetical protein